MIGILVASIQIQTIQAALVTFTMPPTALVSPRAASRGPFVIVLVYCREQVAIFNCKGIAAIPSWNHDNKRYVLTKTSLANHKDNFFFFLTFEVKIKKNKQTTQQLLWVCEWNHIMWPFKIKSYWAVLSCGTVYYAVQRDSNFWVCGWNPMV